MRGTIILLHLGLLVLHSQGYWVPGKQYNYELYTETITSHDSKFDGSKNIGLVTQGNLIIQPQNDTYLRAQIRNSQYRDDMDIPATGFADTGFEKFPISQKTFGISLSKNGIIKSLEIDESIPTWELNYYKGLLGLLQINMSEKNATMFQSVEDFITGRCEVIYDITRINEKDAFIAKTKNFLNCDDVTEYHSRATDKLPLNSNENGNLLNKFFSSKSTVKDYWENPTITRSEIFSQVTVQLSSNLPDTATLTSKLKLSLVTSADVEKELSPVSNAQSIESLHYVRNNPFENPHSRILSPNYDEKLTEAPSFLLLPYFIGNEGNVVWKDRSSLVNTLKTMTLGINNDLNKNDLISNEAIEKMSILVDLIRTLNVKQIDDVVKSFNEKLGAHDSKVNVFYKAVGLAGTGPALLSVKKWIQENKIDENEAFHAVEALSKNVLMPTIKYLDEYFSLINMDNVKNSDILYQTAVLSFADLIQSFIARGDWTKKSRTANMYKTHSNKDETAMTEKYLQFYAEQLKKSVDQKDNRKISLFTLAIGKTNHRKILSVFKPYIEGDIPLSVHQRTWMIISLSKFAKSWPEIARSVLYKIYVNVLGDYEVRCAAVYLIMQTNPPVNVLQKMADFTKYDRNKHVRAIVKLAIHSAAELKDNDELSRSAKAAKLLLDPRIDTENYSLYMKDDFNTRDNIFDYMTILNRYNDLSGVFGDYDSEPSVLFPNQQFRLLISDIRNIFNDPVSRHTKDGNKFFKFSTENITKILGIKPEHIKQLEGLLLVENKYSTLFLTLEDLIKSIKKSTDDLNSSEGVHSERIKFYSHRNHDLTITFPTDTGMIFYYTLQNPIVFKSESSYSLDTEKVEFEFGLNALFVQSSIGRLGFVAPSKNTLYEVGYDEHIQLNIPVHVSLLQNDSEQYFTIKVEPLNKGKTYNLLRRKTFPFVTKINFLELKPVSKNLHTKIIKSENIFKQRFAEIPGITWESFASTFGDENQSMIKFLLFDDKFRWSSMTLNWDTDVDNKQEANLTIFYDLKNSTTKNFTDIKNIILEADAGKIDSQLSNDPNRRQKLLNEVLRGLNSGEAIALDAFLELKWYESINIMANTAFSYSEIDNRIKHLGHYKIKYSDQSLDLCANLDARSSPELTFDPKQTVKSIPFAQALGDIHFGLEDCHNAKIKIDSMIHQSESRKSDVLQEAKVKECLSSADNTLVNCAKALELNYLADELETNFIFDETTDIFKTGIIKGLTQISQFLSDDLQASRPKRKWDENKIKLTLKIIPKETLEIVINTSEMDFTIKDAKALKKNANMLVEQQPDTNDILMFEQSLDYINLDLINNGRCIVDDTEIKTFDENIYNFTSLKCWQVILTAVPHYVNDEPQIDEESRISILMKDSAGDKRDLVIVLGNHKISFYVHDSSLNVAVDDKAVMNSSVFFSQYDDERNISLFNIYKSPEQFYSLSSSFHHDIDVKFDGKHLVVEIDDNLRTKLRGLCGNFDSDEENDLETPGQCKENEKLFAYSWVLEKDSCEDDDFKRNFNSDLKKICKKNETLHLSVINDKEAGVY